MYSEMAYFDNNHCAHCAVRDEHLRLTRIRREARAVADRRHRVR